ncbi:hypothetical protein [Kineococcus rubinsiae]|uniref:hypothetical protein n=1 Tax=Kineococcus rubinsiae TaxID=2609562 RepID=UPI00142FEE24|nr:hypothetical protein [Kineococcus rubinsiae]NIZ90414.1 hypothetical protein [Kineococcus rubinsiae]
MTRKSMTTLAFTGLAVTCAVAVGAWQLLTPTAPTHTTLIPTKQVTSVSDTPTPSYADDDDSDEADIWRLKQADLARVDSPEDPLRDFEGPQEPIPTSGTIYTSSDDEELALLRQQEWNPDPNDPLRDPSQPSEGEGPTQINLSFDEDSDSSER